MDKSEYANIMIVNHSDQDAFCTRRGNAEEWSEGAPNLGARGPRRGLRGDLLRLRASTGVRLKRKSSKAHVPISPFARTPIAAGPRVSVSRLAAESEPRNLVADFLAGLTGAIVVLPQGVAFATIAGMPPQYGLYAGIVPTLVAALFGSSWHLVAGPSTTASLILFASLSAFAEPGSARYVELALTLAAMVGLIELALGVFKLGVIVNFISHSVVVGYTAGVGVLIIVSQARNFFGIPMPRGAEFVDVIASTFAGLPALSWPTTAVALATLTSGIAARRFLPRVPFMILAIVIGGLVAAILNVWKPGSVTTVGALPSHLPPLSAPSFDPDTWRLLIPTALAVAISALNEVVSISRALAIRSEQHVNINQEFIGQGLANAIGCFFSGYVVSGSFNRSALNYDAGARTPMAALFAAGLLAVFLVVAAPLAAYLPHAAMAASLVLVGWGLIDRKSIARIAKTSRTEVGVLLVTILTALFVHIQMAILVGVALSLLIYLYRTSNPRLRPRVPDPISPGRKFTDPAPGLPECPQLRLVSSRRLAFLRRREQLPGFAARNRGEQSALQIRRHRHVRRQFRRCRRRRGARDRSAADAQSRRRSLPHQGEGTRARTSRTRRLPRRHRRRQYLPVEDASSADDLSQARLRHLPPLRSSRVRRMRAHGQAGTARRRRAPTARRRPAPAIARDS